MSKKNIELKQNFKRQLEYGLFYFEPLLMLYLDHQWVHPLIDVPKFSLIDTYCGLHRIQLHFADNTTATLVVTSRAIDHHWAGVGRGDLKDLIEACLLKDKRCSTDGVWYRTGERFCSTELGKAFRQAFSKGEWSLEISRSEIGTITLGDDGFNFVTNKEMAARARTARLQ
jgi:hypothetical protein